MAWRPARGLVPDGTDGREGRENHGVHVCDRLPFGHLFSPRPHMSILDRDPGSLQAPGSSPATRQFRLCSNLRSRASRSRREPTFRSTTPVLPPPITHGQSYPTSSYRLPFVARPLGLGCFSEPAGRPKALEHCWWFLSAVPAPDCLGALRQEGDAVSVREVLRHTERSLTVRGNDATSANLVVCAHPSPPRGGARFPACLEAPPIEMFRNAQIFMPGKYQSRAEQGQSSHGRHLEQVQTSSSRGRANALRNSSNAHKCLTWMVKSGPG